MTVDTSTHLTALGLLVLDCSGERCSDAGRGLLALKKNVILRVNNNG